MDVDGKPFRSIWLAEDGWSVEIIDQTRLPHDFVVARLQSVNDVARAISEMMVRGAPLIGAAAAYGICLAAHEDSADDHLHRMAAKLIDCRPTAVNLQWAVERMMQRLLPLAPADRLEAAYLEAAAICEEDVATNEAIGRHGLSLIQDVYERKSRRGVVNILTHCNAGWLATVDWGTALAPVYQAHRQGIPVHVWVDETRPRNQGAFLTAWELAAAGIDHHLIVDNAGGHLMQQGLVDLCIVGTDRTAANGDVCNKIGTYLKALAARDNQVPFHVALPGSTIDWKCPDGRAIVIEERGEDEVLTIRGLGENGLTDVRLAGPLTRARNPAFDVTPARLVTGLITERGCCPASRDGLLSLYPSRGQARETASGQEGGR